MPSPASFLDSPRQTSWRKAFFQVHLWLGLILRPIAAFVALTGSIIVFRYELNRVTVPGTAYVKRGAQRLSAQRLSLDELASRIQSARPHDKLVQASWESGPDTAWNFRTQSPQGHRIHTFIDQYSGRITGQEDYQGKMLQGFYDLHADLLAGDTGRTINGFVALVTMILACAGLVIWWPGRGKWRFGFVYLRGARWQRQNYDLHKLAGFYSSLALLVVAFSGAYFSFPHLYQQAIASLTGSAVSIAAPRSTSLWGQRLVPLKEFIRIAEQEQPGARAISFSFPQKKGDAVNVRLMETHDWHRIGLNFVYLEPKDAHVICSERFRTDSMGTKIVMLMYPFHFGRFGGRMGTVAFYAVMVPYTVMGIVPAVLAVTGMLMYWNRVLSKRWKGTAKTVSVLAARDIG